MRKFSGDSIKINVDTGHNSAGNGGDGHSYGTFTNNATINFDGDNKIEKAHADDVHQINKVSADQSQNVAAGNGGDGGDGNLAAGGNVDIHLHDFIV
ncbi:MAG TPA: hypothetical protein VMT72_03975 [Pseudolabrys sp.]|jgi:hypothetical protein|nr:hypothetical protein [Pseudolabrys sp.]